MIALCWDVCINIQIKHRHSSSIKTKAFKRRRGFVFFMFKYIVVVCEICDDGITSQINTTRFSQSVWCHRVDA